MKLPKTVIVGGTQRSKSPREQTEVAKEAAKWYLQLNYDLLVGNFFEN